MDNRKKIGIAVAIGLAIGTTIIVFRHKVKAKGWTYNKNVSKLFKVPLVDKKYMDLQEQTENQETKEGITFRATGTEPLAQKFTKLDACVGQCVAPKKCYKGICL
jgi:hypothetical protein